MELKSNIIEKLIQSQNKAIEDLSLLAANFEKLNLAMENLTVSLEKFESIDALVNQFSKIDELVAKVKSIEDKANLLYKIKESLDEVKIMQYINDTPELEEDN